VPALLVEVTQEWEIATTSETTHATAMLTAKASACEAVAVWDSAALCVKDAEHQAALEER
jgi:hypothetical protein